ncbi:hypothetical protein ACRAWF_06805 [Streptomyces sp. L7]
MIQHYFGLFLAWLLLDRATLERPGTTPAMLLFLLGSAAIVACACAADDVAGYRNGSDAINYQEGETLRDIRKKPLLSGAVTERQAIGFAVSAGARRRAPRHPGLLGAPLAGTRRGLCHLCRGPLLQRAVLRSG